MPHQAPGVYIALILKQVKEIEFDTLEGSGAMALKPKDMNQTDSSS